VSQPPHHIANEIDRQKTNSCSNYSFRHCIVVLLYNSAVVLNNLRALSPFSFILPTRLFFNVTRQIKHLSLHGSVPLIKSKSHHTVIIVKQIQRLTNNEKKRRRRKLRILKINPTTVKKPNLIWTTTDRRKANNKRPTMGGRGGGAHCLSGTATA
jgi:hypothetical protein